MADLLPAFLEGKSVSTPKGMRWVSEVQASTFLSSGVTATSRLFGIFASEEKQKEKQHKNRQTSVYFSVLSGAWDLKAK